MTHSTETGHFLDISTEMFACLRFDGDFVPLNPAWEKTLGYTRAELQSQPWFSLIHPEDRDETLAAIGALKTGKRTTVAFENRVQCKDASYRQLSWARNAAHGRRTDLLHRRTGCYAAAGIGSEGEGE